MLETTVAHAETLDAPDPYVEPSAEEKLRHALRYLYVRHVPWARTEGRVIGYAQSRPYSSDHIGYIIRVPRQHPAVARLAERMGYAGSHLELLVINVIRTRLECIGPRCSEITLPRKRQQ